MSEIITTLTFFFVAASLMIFILERYSNPKIPGFILAGILIGSFVNYSDVLGLSQIGIAFLVFIFGIKADLSRIKQVGEESASTTLIQIVVVGTTLYIVGRGIGYGHLNTLYFSVAGALSSSLVGLELVKGELRNDLLHGRLAEAIQLFQDLIAVLLISVVLTTFSAESLVTSLAFLGITLLGALAVRNLVLDKVAYLADGSRELLTLFALSTLAIFVGLTQQMGSSLVIGSFAAGLAVSKFPHNAEILDTMGSLKDFFSAIFFISLGALISFPSTEVIILTLVLVSTTLFLKPIMTGIGLLINGYDRRTAYLTGLSLDQVSEFGLIIAIQAQVAGTIADPIFQSIILSATITMITSSYTSRAEEEIYDTFSKYSPIDVNSRKINRKTSIPEEMSEHVILVGYHTQGKEIAEGLRKEEQDFIVIENDPEKIMEIADRENYYVFGDVMDAKTWEKARFKNAKMIVSTVPFTSISEEILDLDTEADKILRAEDIKGARQLLENGAFYVNVPDILSSEELLDHVNGVLEDRNYREELRRRNLLDIRAYLQDSDEK